MRILALYDVHGNPDALEAVLADPRAAGPDAPAHQVAKDGANAS